jgi:succinoglycan biosynthesis protein ExoH
MARYGGLAFFLHAAHFPLLAEVKILLWPLLPAETDGWMLAHYAASVLITIGLGVAAGILLARLFPRAFAFLNGGRAALG